MSVLQSSELNRRLILGSTVLINCANFFCLDGGVNSKLASNPIINEVSPDKGNEVDDRNESDKEVTDERDCDNHVDPEEHLKFLIVLCFILHVPVNKEPDIGSKSYEGVKDHSTPGEQRNVGHQLQKVRPVRIIWVVRYIQSVFRLDQLECNGAVEIPLSQVSNGRGSWRCLFP